MISSLPYAVEQKEHYMRQALCEAALAYAEGNVPIGAVVVLDGEIVARGRNQRYIGDRYDALCDQYTRK